MSLSRLLVGRKSETNFLQVLSEVMTLGLDLMTSNFPVDRDDRNFVKLDKFSTVIIAPYDSQVP